MRILVTGSRDWADRDLVHSEIRRALTEHQGSGRPVIVNGACPTGADEFAAQYGWKYGVEVEDHPADWYDYGKSAGYRRNAEMVALGADICLAFQRNGSKGTQHTIDLARKAGIPVRVFTEDDANGVAPHNANQASVPSVGDERLPASPLG